MKTYLTFKSMLPAALSLLLGMNVASCTVDDNAVYSGEGQSAYSDPYDKHSEAGIACFNLLSQLSAVGDSLPDDWKTHIFKPLEGKVFFQDTPTVRSVIVDDTNMPLYSKPGLLQQWVPNNLGNKKAARAYAVQLLSVLLHTNEYLEKYGTQNFGSGDMCLSNLPRTAMPNADLRKVAATWNDMNLWNIVKPGGMSVAEFKNYLSQPLTLIYNTFHAQSAVLKIDISKYADAADFFRAGESKTETVATFNMQQEAFNVTTYASTGTGSASPIGSKALVIRFKDGKGLSNTSFSMENVDPTKPLEGVTDVYRFDAN